MDQAIQKALQQISLPFAEACQRVQAGGRFDKKDFLERFFEYADKFADRCCLDMADEIRTFTEVDRVRATTSKALAREIRAEVFEELDSILCSCAEDRELIKSEAARRIDKAEDVSVAGAAVVGGAVGRVAGGAIGAGLGALSSAAHAMSTQTNLRTEAKVILASRLTSVEKHIIAYLFALPRAAILLLDFGASKSFGASVDLQLVRATGERLQTEAQAPGHYYDELMAVTKQAEAARRVAYEEERNLLKEKKALKAQELAAAEAEAAKKQRDGCLKIIVGFFCVYPPFSLVLLPILWRSGGLREMFSENARKNLTFAGIALWILIIIGLALSQILPDPQS